MKTLGLAVPCYNEEMNIRDVYDEIMGVAPYFEEKGVELTILFVDDGSTDGTAMSVRALHDEDERVKLITFSRNFGKEAAIYAGLKKLDDKDYVAIMDCDLQDPPSLLPKLYEALAKDGYDSAATRRVTRQGEPPVRSFFARRFYAMINKMSRTEIVDGARDFRMMTRQFADAVLNISEYNRFSKGIFGFVGYKTKWFEYENIERSKGETKWSFWKLFLYAIDGITAFSTVPLAFASFMGLLFCLIALVFIVVIIARKLMFGDPTSGWPSLVCIILLVGGIQLFCLGVVGQYLSKTYMEVKKRPVYLVKDEIE